jgi:Zn-dependent protease with chaperone function
MRLSPWPVLLVALVSVSGCAESARVVRPDFTLPSHRLAADQFTAALQAAGRRPEDCKLGFIETPELNAASAGDCVFVVTTGVVDTGDSRLVAGIVAHEVAHDILGHANKRKTAAATADALRIGSAFIPVVGSLVSWGVAAASFLALPAYSRSQESDADARAVEILRGMGHQAPVETMTDALQTLLGRYGDKGGGILDSHPGTAERIAALRRLN